MNGSQQEDQILAKEVSSQDESYIDQRPDFTGLP